ncbi:GNAT family N-acetyltransferase, partial [Phenylobacterium sp.]|uniref:GNAT family N-acetyltransferase n=1 Tax=Phenylobacterium sp. TaxID=1871053 RepID=UPI002E329425
MSWPDDVTLRGAHASLEPLGPEHAQGLAAASADGEVWRLWYTRVPSPEEIPAEIERRLKLKAGGMMHPFAVRDA